jgi:hypothetical protein
MIRMEQLWSHFNGLTHFAYECTGLNENSAPVSKDDMLASWNAMGVMIVDRCPELVKLYLAANCECLLRNVLGCLIDIQMIGLCVHRAIQTARPYLERRFLT